MLITGREAHAITWRYFCTRPTCDLHVWSERMRLDQAATLAYEHVAHAGRGGFPVHEIVLSNAPDPYPGPTAEEMARER